MSRWRTEKKSKLAMKAEKEEREKEGVDEEEAAE